MTIAGDYINQHITRGAVLAAIGPLGTTPMGHVKICNVLGVPCDGDRWAEGRHGRMLVDAHLEGLMADGTIERVSNGRVEGYRLCMPEWGWSLVRGQIAMREGGELMQIIRKGFK